MSLTNREKEIAIECWNKCTGRQGVDPVELCGLFLSRIREEQEAVAEIALWPDDRTRVGLDWLIDELPPEGTKLFTTPPASAKKEHDCSELVEALEESKRVILYSIGPKLGMKTIDRIDNAITNHAKRMKEFPKETAISGEE